MGAQLPDLSRPEFGRRLRASVGEELSDHLPERACAALWEHYRELRRWNPRLSLVGPGTAERAVERHYGEALAALPLLAAAATLLDVGSGAGFPGLVLAAVRPDLAVTLVESRERKWAFLQAAARRAGLSCRCLNARVDAAFDPGPMDLVTWRGIHLPAETRAALAARAGRVLVWSGAAEPAPPDGWRGARRVALAGSERRRIVEWVPREELTG